MSPAPVFALLSSCAVTRQAVGRSAGRGAFVDWPPSLRRPPLGRHLAQDHAHHLTAQHPLTRPAEVGRCRHLDRTHADGGDSPWFWDRSLTTSSRAAWPVRSLDTPSPSATSTQSRVNIVSGRSPFTPQVKPAQRFSATVSARTAARFSMAPYFYVAT